MIEEQGLPGFFHVVARFGCEPPCPVLDLPDLPNPSSIHPNQPLNLIQHNSLIHMRLAISYEVLARPFVLCELSGVSSTPGEESSYLQRISLLGNKSRLSRRLSISISDLNVNLDLGI